MMLLGGGDKENKIQPIEQTENDDPVCSDKIILAVRALSRYGRRNVSVGRDRVWQSYPAAT